MSVRYIGAIPCRKWLYNAFGRDGVKRAKAGHTLVIYAFWACISDQNPCDDDGESVGIVGNIQINGFLKKSCDLGDNFPNSDSGSALE